MKFPGCLSWWIVVPIYAFCGLALGLADAQLGQLFRQYGFKPGLATAASVNLLLPLLAVLFGAASPRLATTWAGAIGMTGAFIIGLAVVYPQGHEWVAARLLRAVPPMLVAACLGYAILGSLAALFTRIAWK
jgi:hypothetical protein